MKRQARQKTAASEPLITLDRAPVFMINWWNADYSPFTIGNENLAEFIGRLRQNLGEMRDVLNKRFEQLGKDNAAEKKNRLIIAEFLTKATWAYKAACALRPFLPHFSQTWPNWLYVDWVYRLEEVYTKCFAVAHIFGNDTESQAGLRGLVTDFAKTGGISKNGTSNEDGLRASEWAYYLAYFSATNRHPRAYQKFGELMTKLGTLVSNRYPKVAESLAWHINHRLHNETHGFGNPRITSPEKIALVERMTTLVATLEQN